MVRVSATSGAVIERCSRNEIMSPIAIASAAPVTEVSSRSRKRPNRSFVSLTTMKRPTGLAGIDDRDRDLDGPARQQAPERDLLAGVEVEVAFEAHRRAEVGDRRAGAVLDHREHHARHLADGAHRLQDGVHVAVG